MAAPDDGEAGALEGARQAGGGWVVEDDDVALADVLGDVLRVRGQNMLVEVALLLAELAAVSTIAVDAGVEARGHAHEVGGCVQCEPSHVNAQAERVADQRRDRLGGARSRCGRRRHRPHGASLEQNPSGVDSAVQSVGGDLIQVAL